MPGARCADGRVRHPSAMARPQGESQVRRGVDESAVVATFPVAGAVGRRREHVGHNPLALKAEGRATAVPGGGQEGADHAHGQQGHDLLRGREHEGQTNPSAEGV